MTITLFAAAIATNASADSEQPSTNTPQQRLEVATRAQSQFDEAMSVLSDDPSRARALFADSAAGFRRVVDAGAQSGEMYFNLGNALIQSGEIGQGIGALLEADRLLPADPRVLSNHSHARGLVTGAADGARVSPTIDRIAATWSDVSFSSRRVLSFALWVALCGIVTGAILDRFRRRSLWRFVIAAVGVSCVLVSSTVVVDSLQRSMDPPGVLIHDSVVLRKGNGDGFAPAFTDSFPQGMEFTMLEARPGWYRIRLADGQSGWVKATDAMVVGVPNAPQT